MTSTAPPHKLSSFFTPHRFSQLEPNHETSLLKTLNALSDLSNEATSIFHNLSVDMNRVEERISLLNQFVENPDDLQGQGENGNAVYSSTPQSPAPMRSPQQHGDGALLSPPSPAVTSSLQSPPHQKKVLTGTRSVGEISISLRENSAWATALKNSKPAIPDLSSIPVEYHQVSHYTDAQAPIRHWIYQEAIKKRKEFTKKRKRRRRNNRGAVSSPSSQPIMARKVKKIELYHEKLRGHRFQGKSQPTTSSAPEEHYNNASATDQSLHPGSPLAHTHEASQNKTYTSPQSPELSYEEHIVELPHQSPPEDEQTLTQEQKLKNRHSFRSASSTDTDSMYVTNRALREHGVNIQAPISPTSYQRDPTANPIAPALPDEHHYPAQEQAAAVTTTSTSTAPPPPPAPPLPPAGVPMKSSPSSSGPTGPPPPPPLDLNKLQSMRIPSSSSSPSQSAAARVSRSPSKHMRQASPHASLFDQIKAGNFGLKKSRTRSFAEAPLSPPTTRDNIMSEIRGFQKGGLKSVEERISSEEPRPEPVQETIPAPNAFSSVADILRFNTMNFAAADDFTDGTHDSTDEMTDDDLESW